MGTSTAALGMSGHPNHSQAHHFINSGSTSNQMLNLSIPAQTSMPPPLPGTASISFLPPEFDFSDMSIDLTDMMGYAEPGFIDNMPTGDLVW